MDDRNEALFNAARAGDVNAFGQFIAPYEKLIYNAAYRMVGNRQDAQDMAQETLIKVFRKLDTIKSYGQFRSWLFRVIHNTCTDELRKRKHKPVYSLDARIETEDGAITTQVLVENATPETAYVEKEQNALLQQAISTLSPEFRMMIVLRDINGLSYEDIAQATGLNLGTVKSRIARARSRLKDELLIIREQKT